MLFSMTLRALLKGLSVCQWVLLAVLLHRPMGDSNSHSLLASASASTIAAANLNSHPKEHHTGGRHKHLAIMAPLSFPQLYNCVNLQDFPRNNSDSERRSQSNEDIWLWRNYFSLLPAHEVVGGFYIEMGAYDGIKFSNTYFFEKSLDWRGLLIEAHPDNALSLRVNAKHRANAAIFTGGVCRLLDNGSPGSLPFTNGGGVIGAVISDDNRKFLSIWHKRQNLSQGRNVTCVRLQDYLDATAVWDIELFSLDVEGSEHLVLDTLDWSVTNIRVLLLELDGHNPVRDTHLRSHLRRLGFLNATEAGLGDIQTDACDLKKYGETAHFLGCMKNEVFINPHYMERKLQRMAKYSSPSANIPRYLHRGTGVPCPTQIIEGRHHREGRNLNKTATSIVH